MGMLYIFDLSERLVFFRFRHELLPKDMLLSFVVGVGV